MKTKTIVITGNHHTPAVELVKQLQSDRQYRWKIIYISHFSTSTPNYIQKTIISPLHIKFYRLESGKFDRHNLSKTITGIPPTIKAVKTAFYLLKKIQPQVVVSFGGYVSVPVIIASFFRHLPTITHEQTLTLSLSTLINGLFVNKIAFSFPPSRFILNFFHSKTVITGNLLRSQIYKKTTASFSKINLKNQPLIYVTGGSQGALILNKNLSPILKKLSKNFTVIHQLGNNKSNIGKRKNYYPIDYVGLDDIGWVLNHAIIVISRAGANTCQEIVRLKKRAILIPLPQTQQNEQGKNALWVKENLPDTIIIQQKKLTPNLLLQNIKKLAAFPKEKLSPTGKDNPKILKLIHQLV